MAPKRAWGPGLYGLPEEAREVGDDPRAQRVRHPKDVPMDGVVVADVGGEVTRQPVGRLSQRLVEGRAHHRPHHVLAPEPRVGAGGEVSELPAVRVPGLVRLLEGLLVSGLGGDQDIYRAVDVLLKESRQL